MPLSLTATQAQAQTPDTRVHVVIAGAGAAGLALAARLRRSMPNATITIIDAKKGHHFQPGFTLVGAQASDLRRLNAQAGN